MVDTNGSRRRARRGLTAADIKQPIDGGDGEEDGGGGFEDITIPDGFMDERGTLTVTDEDLPIEIGANPLPAPWQGIRRIGMVLNFSFIWDSDEEEWVRDEGNGGAATLANSFQVGVDSNGDTTVESGSPNTHTVPLTKGFGPTFDPDGVIDTSTDRFTAPADGKYHFAFMGGYDNFTTGNQFQYFLFQVGVRNLAPKVILADDTQETATASIVADLSEGEEVEWRTNHDSPNSEEMQTSTNLAYWSGFRVA